MVKNDKMVKCKEAYFKNKKFMNMNMWFDINIRVGPFWTFDKKNFNPSKIVFSSFGNLVKVSVWICWAIKSTEIVKFVTPEYET